ncbi:MAG: class I SAM-dependent methyltransferase [Acidobacteria bacterium]|jgi:ubiquinone/menaquinone biosynthesis C-methylase UbiE|nr:class I SAM-dependent methyltransferase [Acidobacteriota bacterium]MBA3784584.1 class I SAM-dependent methyltransferase [Acidobacteriota bacterium]MBA4122179.1 class I SAM-dependent methyltransferase [Acidobacteriota bacterium]MBA4183374.1 class I SAM-dependent methyltransferase [Acidobacteriota bacterium]
MPDKYIPALSYDWLTAVYDPVVRLTTREIAFKKALVEQVRIVPFNRVLDLACGTGTLAVLIKKKHPQTRMSGIDGDAKILAIARRKAAKEAVKIEFDEGMSFALPYADESFDRVVSSLFFHHLTRENKLKTLREVFRVLKRGGELHIADWGLPANFLMRIASCAIELLDGAETTSDNFKGLLPSFVAEARFRETEEVRHFDSLFGTIRLLKAKK